MIIFPTLLLAALLILTTIAFLEAPEAGRHFVRERRIYARRPPTRLIAAIVAIELIAVGVWGAVVIGAR